MSLNVKTIQSVKYCFSKYNFVLLLLLLLLLLLEATHYFLSLVLASAVVAPLNLIDFPDL